MPYYDIVIRKYTVALLCAACVLSPGIQACSRRPAEKPSEPPLPAAVPHVNSGSQAPGRTTLEPKERTIRAVPLDRFIGARPLDRIVPEDYTLGLLEDLSGLPGAYQESAPGAAREFLEGLRTGRLAAVFPDSKNILSFLLRDILTGELRVTGWKLGRGSRRPEGGFSYPVLIESVAGRALGEVFVTYADTLGWSVELIDLDVETLRLPRIESPSAFDPTARGVQKMER